MRFTILLVVAVSFLHTGFSQTFKSIRFSVNVTSAPISINAGDIELEGLRAGTTYSAVPDGAGSFMIEPNDGLASIASATEITISGDMNSTILISFVLPTHLYPSSSFSTGFVVTRFTENSAAWGPSGAENNYFDPKVSQRIILDGSGNAYVTLGGIFEVPPGASTDTYLGDALLTAEYTGL